MDSSNVTTIEQQGKLVKHNTDLRQILSKQGERTMDAVKAMTGSGSLRVRRRAYFSQQSSALNRRRHPLGDNVPGDRSADAWMSFTSRDFSSSFRDSKDLEKPSIAACRSVKTRLTIWRATSVAFSFAMIDVQSTASNACAIDMLSFWSRPAS